MIIKVDTNLLNKQIYLIDVYANNASSEHDRGLLDGVANLLSEIIGVSDGSNEVYFEKVNESYTTFLYGNDDDDILDENMFNNKQDAIRYAENNEYDEVINDITGEVVWHQ